MPNRGRLSALVSLILVGLVLSLVVELFLVELPAWRFSRVVLGSELSAGLSGPWLLAAILMILAAAGTESLLRVHPKASGVPIWHMLPYAALPMLLTGTARLIIYAFSEHLPWPISVVLIGVLLYLVFAAEYAVFDRNFPRYNLVNLGLNIANLSMAFILYSAIYQTKARSLESASAILLVTFLLGMGVAKGWGRRTWLYAGVIAVAQGELTWALNYCGLGGGAAGGILTLTYYLAAGPVQEYLAGRITTQVKAEFALVGLAGLVALLATVPLRW